MINKQIQYWTQDGKNFSNATLNTLYESIFLNYNKDWLMGDSEAEINYINNNKSIAGLKLIGTKKGIYIHYNGFNTEKISLYDKNSLNKNIIVLIDEIKISSGLFLPIDLAWEVIKDFINNGKPSNKITWLEIDDIQKNINYL